MPVRTTLLTRENKIPIYPRSDLSQIIDVKTGKDLKAIIADLRKEIEDGTTGVLDRYDEVWASALLDLDTRLHQVVDVYEEIWAAALTALDTRITETNTKIDDAYDDINQTLENVFMRIEGVETSINAIDARVTALEKKNSTTPGDTEIETPDDGGGGTVAPPVDEEVEEITP